VVKSGVMPANLIIELGITMSSIARKLKTSVPAVSKSTIRGDKLAKVG